MAAAKKARSLKNVKNAEGLPIAFDDVMIPLGRAKAALWLLDALEGRNVIPPDAHAAWVRDICLCTITSPDAAAARSASRPSTPA